MTPAEQSMSSLEKDSPSFSVITPSYNMKGYLQRCCASVADQAGVTKEQLVIDACSTDGTVEWLGRQPQLRSIVEPDQGMYDAINKGIDHARGAYISYLNCDEQYLPGTLSKVQSFFESHPGVDFIYGDVLLIRPDGSLLAHRKTYPLRKIYISVSHLYITTATLFYRRGIFDSGLRFDKSYKAIGDFDLVYRLLEKGYRPARLKSYLSVFTMTGQNLGAQKITTQEMDRFSRGLPGWLKLLKGPINLTRLAEKFLSGSYFQKLPIYYEIYTDSLASRKEIQAYQSSSRWLLE